MTHWSPPGPTKPSEDRGSVRGGSAFRRGRVLQCQPLLHAEDVVLHYEICCCSGGFLEMQCA